MKLSRTHIVTLAGLLTVIVLAGYMPVQWFITDSPELDRGGLIAPIAILPRAELDLHALKAAPLFEKSRKPIVIKLAAPLKPVERDPLIGWRVSAVMETPSAGRVAWLQGGDGAAEKVKLGATVMGWKVTTIEIGRVELMKDGKMKILEQGS